MFLIIPIQATFKNRLWKEIVENVYWLDPRIEDICRHKLGMKIRYSGDTIPSETQKSVQNIIEDLVKSHQRVSTREVFANGDFGAGHDNNPIQELLQNGVIQERKGSLEVSGLFLRLMNGLDRKFAEFAKIVDAEEFEFPSFMSLETAEKSGIFENLLHHVHFVNNFESCSIGHISKGTDKQSDSEKVRGPNPPETILSPAVCYQFWNYLATAGADQMWKDEDLRVGTAKGRCYRSEIPFLLGIERLREFNMREVFGIGSAENMASLRDEFLNYTKQLMVQYGLAGRIETATDPFFGPTFPKKRMFQLNMELKYEIQLWIPYKKETIAVGSVNHHRDYFVKKFNLGSSDTAETHSCCLAFGLERFALAIIAQHGLRYESWPHDLRTIL